MKKNLIETENCESYRILFLGKVPFSYNKNFFVMEREEEEYGQNVEEVYIENHKNRNAFSDNGYNERKSFEESEKLISKTFASVSFYGGKISAFSYNLKKNPKNFSDGVCTFSIYGCNCEEFASAQYCIVSFKNNEPNFEVVLPFRIAQLMEKNRQKSSEFFSENFGGEELCISTICNRITELGGFIKNKRNFDKKFEFAFIANSGILYSCLKICGIEAEKAHWVEKMFSVNTIENQCNVKIVFSKNAESDSFHPILQCAQYAYLFSSNLKIFPKKQILPINVLDTIKNFTVKNKIAVTKRKDDSVFVFYKNAVVAGKMYDSSRKIGSL